MALCSRTEVKEYLGMTGSTNDIDQLLKNLCDRISSVIETYCNRKFEQQTYIDFLDSYGTDVIYPAHRPITSVSGIWESFHRSWDEDEIDPDNYYIVNESYIQRTDNIFISKPKTIKIIYTAGYSSIPLDVKHCAITEVARVYDRRKEVGVTNKTYADSSTSYSIDDLLPTTKLVLDRYTMVNI